MTYIRYFSIVVLLLAISAGGCSPNRQVSTVVDPSTMSKIDVHAHYTYPRDHLVSVLDEWNMKAVIVNVITNAEEGKRMWEAMKAHHSVQSDHLILCTSFDASRIDEPGFAEEVVASLKQDVADGAKMVKVWKNIGMVYKDKSGQFIQIDDPRFQPIWDYLTEEGIPVLAHIAEPHVAWLPIEAERPHVGYFRNHPEYHAYQHPEIPRWEAIMKARDRWLEQNPDLVVIGAHLGSMAHDVNEIARRLDAYPNFFVDTAARFVDLADQRSENIRDFFIRYQDRILYGTDIGTHSPPDSVSEEQERNEEARMEKMFNLHWQYLAGKDSLYFDSPMSSYHVMTKGLALPADVLEKVYYNNAARLLKL